MNKIVLGIGIVLVVVGLFSQFYTFTTENTTEGPFNLYSERDTEVNAPYQGFALPLLGLGVVLVIVGALLNR